MKDPLLMHIDYSVFIRGDSLILIDRRFLPQKIVEVVCNDYKEVAESIKLMVVQGAGDIAITAGYGLYLAALEIEKEKNFHPDKAMLFLSEVKKYLANTRPTGYHLAALLEKILAQIDWTQGNWSNQILTSVRKAVEKQQNRSELTGKWAATLLRDGDSILTHCFPGPALLYMLDIARKEGKNINIIATETRPYFQGARLTAWSVSELDIPVTLITDNMVAYCMSQGMITRIFTAADRIAMDGTIANKVGTFQLAIVANYHNLPFNILGYGGPDSRCKSGADIPIEKRDPNEVLYINRVLNTGSKVSGFYPAFDLTPPQFISSIVTDRGILPPENIQQYWTLPRVKD